MIKIDAKRIPFFILIFIIVLIISTIGKKISDKFDGFNRTDEYELIRKYLLNDSSFGNNKPKLWIHSKYMRVCKIKDNYSPTEIEHPYISIIVEIMVEKCHNDFNICLIDDDSFSKLIPDWDVDINLLSEPHKTNCRDLAMLTILYIYGGMIVPNTFLCLKSLKELYDDHISKPFIGEFVINKSIIIDNNKLLSFVPNSRFIGAKKDDSTIRELMEYYRTITNNGHFSDESIFKGNSNEWCLHKCKINKMTIIDGTFLGTKTIDRKPIPLEELMNDKLLALHPKCVGIYISHEELLKRTKYQWFTVSSQDNILRSKTAIAKYINFSIQKTISNPEIKSGLSI